MAELHCILVTPDETVFDEKAAFVVVPLFDGELGVAPKRAPMIGRIGLGELRIDCDRGLVRYYIEGGFVEVLDNVVSILTSRAILAEKINEVLIGEELEIALATPTETSEEFAARDRAIRQFRAQLRVADKL